MNYSTEQMNEISRRLFGYAGNDELKLALDVVQENENIICALRSNGNSDKKQNSFEGTIFLTSSRIIAIGKKNQKIVAAASINNINYRRGGGLIDSEFEITYGGGNVLLLCTTNVDKADAFNMQLQNLCSSLNLTVSTDTSKAGPGKLISEIVMVIIGLMFWSFIKNMFF